MRLMSVILVSMLLAGCSGRTLCHPTKTPEDYRRESYECEEQALLRSSQWGNAGLLFLKESEKQRCLKERFGWRECNATAAEAQAGAGMALAASSPVRVAPQVYTHTVRQAFGGAQSPDEARAAAVARAKREVLEKAGTYLESLSEVREGQVARDEVLAMAAGVFQVEIMSERNYVDGQAFGIEVTARIEVDPGVLRQMVADRRAGLEAEPATAEQYHERGRQWGRMGQYERAIRDFDQAIRLDAINAQYYTARAISYLMLKNAEAGCRDLRDACALGDCTIYDDAVKEGVCR